MWKRLMNGSIARFRGSSRRREKTMTTTCSRYTSCSTHGLKFTCKRLFFPIKQVRKKLIPERDPCIRRPCMDSNDLMQSISYTAEA
jgi:hypothetical protein